MVFWNNANLFSKNNQKKVKKFKKKFSFAKRRNDE
jgi:hypothetical protein